MKWDELEEDSDSCFEDRCSDECEEFPLGPPNVAMNTNVLYERDALRQDQTSFEHKHKLFRPYSYRNRECQETNCMEQANPSSAMRISPMRRAGTVVLKAVRGAVKSAVCVRMPSRFTDAVANASPIRWASNNLQFAQKRIRLLRRARESLLFFPGDELKNNTLSETRV